MKPTFSAVIPTLARPGLVDALASVLQQVEPPSEIIVVNNGPIGSNAEDLLGSAGIDDERITLLSLPPRSGPGMSRNVGAWHATADYVAFLDDDDLWADDYLMHMAERIEATDADLLFGARVFLDKQGMPSRTKRPGDIPVEAWLDVLLEGRNPGVGGQNLVVRRDAFFEIGGFPIDLTSGQDRSFTLRALQTGLSLATLDDARVYLRDPPGYRATGRTSNWFNDIKILADNWGAMRWSQRARHSRMVVARARATRHNKGRLSADS